MVKYLFILLITLLAVQFAPISLSAQEESKWPELDVSPMDMATYPYRAAFRNYLGEEGKDMVAKVRVLYSRPKVKGRTIFGELIPFGSDWRLGANEATEVSFLDAVAIGEKALPRGTYTMHATVQENEWTINFSTQQSLWGSANRDKEQDVASITVPVKKLNESVEEFSITFQRVDDDHCNMVMAWEKTQVSVPIDFNPIIFSGNDASPMDLVQYPSQSRFHNYLKPEELEGMEPRVRLIYGRPQKMGREVFGKLVPFGEVWRVGANESSELRLFQTTQIGGEEVRAGVYALYALVNEAHWDIILSTDLPAWGSANRDESKDVTKFRVSTYQEDESVEALSVIFRDQDDGSVHMIVAWDQTRAAIPINFD